jgi:hypothetical protein
MAVQGAPIPDWQRIDDIAVATVHSGELPNRAELRRTLQALWQGIAASEDLAHCVLIFEGPPAAPSVHIADEDGDPTVGPLSCGCQTPVTLGLNGVLDSTFFPLAVEAHAVVATPESELRDTASRTGDGSLPLAGILPIPWPEITRLAVVGSLTAERAHQLGLVVRLCRPNELVDVTLEVARSLPLG